MSAFTLSDYASALARSRLCDESAVQQATKEYLQATEPPRRSAEGLAEFLAGRDLVTAWQNAQLLQGRFKGFFLGRYKLLEQLGRGGMAGVYLAEDALLQRKLALKILPPSQASGPTSHLARFQREAKALAMLRHDNIVRVYDIDMLDGMHFIAMEFVDGVDLQRLVGQCGPLGESDAISYARQTAAALEHAHQSGLVHRDIKPANLLLNQHGVIKLLDLGVARMTDDETSLTVLHDDRMLGTADFIAPEQALNSHTVDPAADIYSLGCTLYFLLTGRAPFPIGTAAERLLAHQMKAPPDVREERSRLGLGAIDDRLAALCAQMLAKSPADRPTASTLHDALQAIATGAKSAGPPNAEVPAAASAKPPAKAASRATVDVAASTFAKTMNPFGVLDTRVETASEVAPRPHSKSKSSRMRAPQRSRSGPVIIAGAGLLLLALAAGGAAFGLQALWGDADAMQRDEFIAAAKTPPDAIEQADAAPADAGFPQPQTIKPVVDDIIEPPAGQSPASPAAGGGVVKYYVVGNGKKYHRADCRHVTAAAREITAADAQANYQPCKVCKPDP